MLHAIIDIGSNTIRMAIYEIKGHSVEMLMKKKHTVGLASYLEDGRMQQAGIDKAVEVLREFRSFLDSFHIMAVSAFTTAALRNAKNSREAVSEVERRTGFSIRVISGDEEAELDFIGATHELAEDTGLLVDIGGASTEIVFFEDKKIVKKRSFHMGSLFFHRQFVKGVLPTAEECEKMRREAERLLGEAEEFSSVSHSLLCGIGGTFKGGLALCRELYGKQQRPMRREELCALRKRFIGPLTDENIAHLMRAVPERIHTILPGLVIAEVIAEHFACDAIRYSDSGVREGFIYSQIVDK